jgi:GntR family transcriptional regulator / MocR family aminotransferase
MRSSIPLAKDDKPLYRQVYLRFREAILSGAFAPGKKLPSTRDLAAQMGISRTVTVLVYEQLASEGFVAGKAGSGTYVSADLNRFKQPRSEESRNLRLSRYGSSAVGARARLEVPLKRQALRYDFAYGRSDLEDFPFEMWRRTFLRCARMAPVSELDYGPACGSVALREAICTHLRHSRAVVCDPEQIIVVNGSQQALDLITRVLLEHGDKVVIEEPSYQGTREILLAAGAKVLGVPVDRDGLNIARLPQSARLVFVTPSHQFPTGVVLPLSRRLALLEWAKRKDAVVVEDDYDGEFRYEGQPVDSLQGLDNEGRVIYVGTFSRTIFSSLRIGYLISPRRLLPALTAAKWLSDRQTATLEQNALAEFISDGTYGRYLRRVRRKNASRRQALLNAVRIYLGNRVEITGESGGAHLVLWLKARTVEDNVIEAAASRGVGVYGIRPYFTGTPPRGGLLLGYSRMREKDVAEGIRRLGSAF